MNIEKFLNLPALPENYGNLQCLFKLLSKLSAPPDDSSLITTQFFSPPSHKEVASLIL